MLGRKWFQELLRLLTNSEMGETGNKFITGDELLGESEIISSEIVLGKFLGFGRIGRDCGRI